MEWSERRIPFARRDEGWLTVIGIDLDIGSGSGTKLRALGEDTYFVRELTEERMVLTFASDGLDHVFYRKN